jgi:hypothetical protein
MSVVEPRSWVLRNERLREWVASFILTAPLGCRVEIGPEGRSTAQNKRLHGMIADAVAGGFATDDGRRLDLEDTKTAFVTGWMIENGLASDIVLVNGRPVQLRRSTKTFDKAELTSLMDFIESECAKRGIPLRTDND